MESLKGAWADTEEQKAVPRQQERSSYLPLQAAAPKLLGLLSCQWVYSLILKDQLVSKCAGDDNSLMSN